MGSYTHAEIVGNVISDNMHGVCSGGMIVEAAEGTLVQNNIIRNKSAPYVEEIATDQVQSVSLIDNLVYNNSAGVGSGPVQVPPPS